MINLIVGLWAAGWTIWFWSTPADAFWCGANFVVAIWCLTDLVRDLT